LKNRYLKAAGIVGTLTPAAEACASWRGPGAGRRKMAAVRSMVTKSGENAATLRLADEASAYREFSGRRAAGKAYLIVASNRTGSRPTHQRVRQMTRAHKAGSSRLSQLKPESNSHNKFRTIPDWLGGRLKPQHLQRAHITVSDKK